MKRFLALALAPLLGALLSSPPARAQVGPGDWFFEIDGDYRIDGADRSSVLGRESIPSSLYTIRSRNITDGEGADRHSTYAPRQGYAIADGRPACTNWWHEPSAPYMGQMSYRVECRYAGERSIDPENNKVEPRRSEQMLLNDWYTGDDSARYFTLAFRFAINENAVPQVNGGYITQWHHGGSGAPAVRLSWVYDYLGDFRKK